MLKTSSKKIAVAGLLLALGIILPFATAHAFGIQGNIILPMHLPVFLCGFACGPLYGGVLGIALPLLNSLLTGMPAIYPNGVMMSLELLGYGLISGLIYKYLPLKNHILKVYISLVTALVSGRIIYGLAANTLLFLDVDFKGASVIAATITGIPGIIAQLIIVPIVISLLYKKLGENAFLQAKELIKNKKFSAVVVRNNKIIRTEKSRGIGFILRLHSEGELKDTLVADAIIGKAAAMVFSSGGVKACYGETMSKAAKEWLQKCGIAVSYNTLTASIINREGTDICPMEKTVLHIYDAEEGVQALKEKLQSLKSK